MKRTNLEVCLLILFLASLGINFWILAGNSPKMPPASRGELALQLLKVHSVPLTILIATIFTSRPKRGKVNGLLCGVAFLLCAAWCGFITTAWQGFPVPVSAVGESSVSSFIADRASNTLFLIAGVLAYLSGTKTSDTSETQSAGRAKA